MYTVGALSEWTLNGVVIACSVASRPAMFAFSSPTLFDGQVGTAMVGQVTWLYVHGVVTPSQALLGVPPAKWSFSSAVTTNSVLLLSIPSAARRVKNAANASSYDFSAASY